MATEPQRYLAFLLRVWHVTSTDGSRAWRASVEDVHTGARQGFGSLEQLHGFLLEETAGAPAPFVDPEVPMP